MDEKEYLRQALEEARNATTPNFQPKNIGMLQGSVSTPHNASRIECLEEEVKCLHEMIHAMRERINYIADHLGLSR
jgi:hypothetical protein